MKNPVKTFVAVVAVGYVLKLLYDQHDRPDHKVKNIESEYLFVPNTEELSYDRI